MKSNHCVLLTRPADFNNGLQSLLRKAGIRSIERPMLEIKSLSMTPEIKSLVMNLDQQDSVIFVSQNAVSMSISTLEEYWPQWPQLSWFAVGKGTAQALLNLGIRAIYPDKASSEDLLALPELQKVQDSKIMIVRGQGGRELLAEKLNQRGARISYLETYSRVGIDYGETLGKDLYKERVDFCIATSLEGLNHLSDSLNRAELAKLHLIVPSSRIAAGAGNRGWAGVYEAAGADDEALLQSILKATLVM
jgi:uroporphyrinogen-III synthase